MQGVVADRFLSRGTAWRNGTCYGGIPSPELCLSRAGRLRPVVTKMPSTLGWLLQLVSLAGATHLPGHRLVTVRSLRSVGTRRLPGLGYLWWWGLGVLLAGAAWPSLQIPLGKAMAGPCRKEGRRGWPLTAHCEWGPDQFLWVHGCFQVSKWLSGEWAHLGQLGYQVGGGERWALVSLL